MPSLTDIPVDLLNAPDKNAFLRWLNSTPIMFNHKRSLAQLWSRDTQIPLNQADWQLIKNTSWEATRTHA